MSANRMPGGAIIATLYAVGAAVFIAGAVMLFAAYSPENPQLESSGIACLLVAWFVLVIAAIFDTVRRLRPRR